MLYKNETYLHLHFYQNYQVKTNKIASCLFMAAKQTRLFKTVLNFQNVCLIFNVANNFSCSVMSHKCFKVRVKFFCFSAVYSS